MEVSLKVLEGSSAGKEIKVPGSKFFIGRADDCQLRPKSDAISRHHCAIIITEGLATVRDFKSRNGTFVNEEQVEGDRPLKNGDLLRVGPLQFEVQLTQSVGGQKRPKVKDIKDAAVRTAETIPVKGEEDITKWLLEDSPMLGSTQIQEEDELSDAADTGPVPDATQVATTSVGSTEEPLKKSSISGKKTFGKLPTVPTQQGPKDSREAAAEMLKKLFKNR